MRIGAVKQDRRAIFVSSAVAGAVARGGRLWRLEVEARYGLKYVFLRAV